MCHVERRLCTTSTYSYRLSPFFLPFFSVFSPFLLHFFSISLYVSRSPNLLRPFSFSPKFLEVFSPSHYVRRFFSYRRSGAGAIVPRRARIAKLSCSGSIPCARFIHRAGETNGHFSGRRRFTGCSYDRFFWAAYTVPSQYPLVHRRQVLGQSYAYEYSSRFWELHTPLSGATRTTISRSLIGKTDRAEVSHETIKYTPYSFSSFIEPILSQISCVKGRRTVLIFRYYIKNKLEVKLPDPK